MRTDSKPNFHNRPPHFLKESGYYFITGRTVYGQWFLRPDTYKQVFLNILFEKSEKFEFSVIAYAVLQNHYHTILNINNAKLLPKFIASLHGVSSKNINNLDGVIGRKLWWNYYDKLLLDEKDFYTHLNYIHQNPIKHCVFKKFKYQFSSYNQWVKKKGKEYLDDCFAKYPIIDFKMFNDEF